MIEVPIFAGHERRTSVRSKNPGELWAIAEAGDDLVYARHVLLPHDDIEVFKFAKGDVPVRLHGGDGPLIRDSRDSGIPEAIHHLDELGGENQAARCVCANGIAQAFQLLRWNDFRGARR